MSESMVLVAVPPVSIEATLDFFAGFSARVGAGVRLNLGPLHPQNFQLIDISGENGHYVTSAIYTGTPDPARDADLEAIQFIASPWSLAEPAALAPHPDGELPATHRQLFALGVDSYLLHAQFTGNLPGMAQPIHGQTGTLMLDGGGRIQRTQPWARFAAGRAIPLGEPGQ